MLRTTYHPPLKIFSHSVKVQGLIIRSHEGFVLHHITTPPVQCPTVIFSVTPTTISPAAKKSEKSQEVSHRDSGKHWCSITYKWLNSVGELLSHLHSDEYHQKLPVKDQPWKKRSDLLKQG